MIRHIYFDLGGVVILDFSGTNKSEELKQGLKLTDKYSALFDQILKKYADKYNFCIDFDVDRLLPIFEKESGFRFPDQYSLLADIVERFDPNPSIWPVIETAKRQYTIGLLTNMYPRMFDAIHSRGIIPTVSWDVIVDSSIVGLQKPDRKIFQLAERLANVNSNEVLFIDNMDEHLQTARDIGWQTFLYDSTHPQDSSNKLAELINGIR